MQKVSQKKINQKYLLKIIKDNPQICSGRKNYDKFYNRILKNILLTKVYSKNKIREFYFKKITYLINKKEISIFIK